MKFIQQLKLHPLQKLPFAMAIYGILGIGLIQFIFVFVPSLKAPYGIIAYLFSFLLIALVSAFGYTLTIWAITDDTVKEGE